jgi:hypothetical protein
MNLEKITNDAFIDELTKIATNKSEHIPHTSSMYAPIKAAGKGGKWGAILGGGVTGTLAHQGLRLAKIDPKNKAYLPILIASILGGSLYGGSKGAYIGAAMGGAEKVTSHLKNS